MFRFSSNLTCLLFSQKQIAIEPKHRIAILQIFTELQSVFDLLLAVELFKLGHIHLNALEIVGCKDLKHRKLGSLSGGELQRVMLANALYPLPELLLLDEPVSGVDAAGSEKFYEVIKGLKQNYHMAIAMVSHDLGIVRDFADNVVLINKSVLKSGNAKDVFNSPEFKSSFYSLSEGEAE